MARLPLRLPEWAAYVYRGDEIAWREAKRQCRAALFESAWAGWPTTYGDLVKRVRAIGWPQAAQTDGGSQLDLLLGQVALGELRPDEERPVMSALAVGPDSVPGSGFWHLCAELGLDVDGSEDARYRFWVNEMNACIAYYGQRER